MYLVVSAHGDTYVTFDDKYVTSCSDVGIQRCNTQLMETSILVPSCILGLFLNDRNMTAVMHTVILTSPLPRLCQKQLLTLGKETSSFHLWM